MRKLSKAQRSGGIVLILSLIVLVGRLTASFSILDVVSAILLVGIGLYLLIYGNNQIPEK